jgi:hypothetical protein
MVLLQITTLTEISTPTATNTPMGMTTHDMNEIKIDENAVSLKESGNV